MADVSLQQALPPWLEERLGVRLRRRTPVSGGCIHGAWRLELEGGGALFAKGGDAAALPLLQLEADGLAALAIAGEGSGLTLPRPRALGLCGDEALLVLDWLELDGSGSDERWSGLGSALARLHRTSLERPCAEADRLDGRYGWPIDNVIGSSPQPNGWLADWGAFFVERRLRPQLQALERCGRAPRQGERLLQRARALLAGHAPPATLVHGDLWSGNAALTRGGGGALFDPAVHRADREVDLAMARLFGGFPQAFFRGYESLWPLPEGHRQRVPLYNLYHLLNHANLFGGGYHGQVQAAIEALL